MQLSIETKSILLSAIGKLRFSFEQMENAHELVKAIKKHHDHSVGDGTTAHRVFNEWERNVVSEAIKTVGFSADSDYNSYQEIKSLLNG